MIHTIHTMNIRQYGQLDSSGDLGLLRRWYNPFPVKWFDTDRFFTQYNEMIGQENDSVSTEKYRLLSYLKILKLDRMLPTMSVLMQNANERGLFTLIFKGKVKDHTGNLQLYIDKVKQATGIEVKDGNDLKKLQKETTRLIDKYKERHPQQTKVVETRSFTFLAMGVFEYMNLDYNPDMNLYEYGELKAKADKKSQPKAA